MTRFELEQFHRNVPDDDLLADIRHVAAKNGVASLTMERYAAGGRFGCETVRRRFGSWNAALQRAGLQPSKRWRIPNETLFANLEALWRRLGRQPRRTDLDVLETDVSRAVYEQRFGSWSKALAAFVAWANDADKSELLSVTVSGRRRTLRQPSLRLRFRVMRHDRFCCRHCGRSPASTPGLELRVDHITPWAQGGETVLENLQTLCEPCNQGKGSLWEAP